MISIYKNKNVISTGNGNKGIELRGLSTDTKPTEINGEEIDNGSVFIEMDTGKVYFYDLDTTTWKEV